MEHHRPHRAVKFEGYYNRFLLPSGATIILIISTVPNGEQRQHMVCFTYVPSNSDEIFQQEIYTDDLRFEDHPSSNSFELRVPSGLASYKGEGKYLFQNEDIWFQATITKRTPWSSRAATPEALLVYLPLPLHWHVQSLASTCNFTLKLPQSYHIPQEDTKGTAIAHEEKNWAKSFPSAHIWLQARSGSHGICLAGGKIIGMEAFLAGYRDDEKGIEIDFRPPFAVRFLGIAPFMTFEHDWDNRTFSLTVQDFTRKMVVRASAPKGSFFGLGAPMSYGHRPNALAQSMKTTIEVEVWSRSLWSWGWTSLCKDKFEGGALEYGGDYYPLAGTDKKRN